MSEVATFINDPAEEPAKPTERVELEVVQGVPDPAPRRTFSDENRIEARRIIDELADRRRALGLGQRLGRLGLTNGVGVNRSEAKLPKPE